MKDLFKFKDGLRIHIDNIITVNDVELGFWGAQSSGVGIHMVAVTGAIEFSRTDLRLTYRSNG